MGIEEDFDVDVGGGELVLEGLGAAWPRVGAEFEVVGRTVAVVLGVVPEETTPEETVSEGTTELSEGTS